MTIPSPFHSLWTITTAYESRTGVPLVIGDWPAEVIAEQLVDKEDITMSEARTIVHALVLVIE